MIELIVVIAIVGLVATVTLASLGAARQRGADASKIRAVAEIRSALGIYFSENGKFPTGNVTTGVADLTTALVVPKYISSIDTNIKYQSINTTNTVCTTNCQ